MADAFSGEGARPYGGRWNPKGMQVVYTASSRALAILEMLIQDQPLRARYVIVAAKVPSTVRIERVAASALPADWANVQYSTELRAIGAHWLKCAKAAVLCVPSTVVASEYNHLLNPAHTEFSRIKQSRFEPLTTDHRLLQKLSDATRRKSRTTRT